MDVPLHYDSSTGGCLFSVHGLNRQSVDSLPVRVYTMPVRLAVNHRNVQCNGFLARSIRTPTSPAALVAKLAPPVAPVPWTNCFTHLTIAPQSAPIVPWTFYVFLPADGTVDFKEDFLVAEWYADVIRKDEKGGRLLVPDEVQS